MTRIISVEDARKRLGRLVEEAAQGPVVLTRRGSRPAILLSLDKYEQLEHLANAEVARRLEDALTHIQAAVAERALPTEAVAEAIAHVRSQP